MVFLHILIVEVKLSSNTISILPPVDLILPASEPKSRSDFHPLFSPSPQTLDHWLQTGAGFCQLVAYPHWRPRNDRAPDDPLRLTLSHPPRHQPLREPPPRPPPF